MIVRLLRISVALAAVWGDGPGIDEPLVAADATLADDGRIGKVIDVQGTVSVKPVMQRRWTPVTGPVILQAGDWLRTDLRGANAVAVRLVKGAHLTLGPGTLVELTTSHQIKLLAGELKIAARKRTPVELLGPKGRRRKVDATGIFRVDRQKEQVVTTAQPPLWLQGFEGSTSHDSTGSLVANVDGRNVPLTVGYHKVSVDIRDQIARTVIEESFQNRTDGRLEGVFYFPLPQDASISGFGMWIGDELVEADVVEKQRAREIYETILRERRDPGLLEWTGGNLFKARVFPIEPHSEKRIKITYTQVLPVNSGRYRYSYGLQSEMLQLHPLRELAIDVKISSVLPLAGVTSPTHMARINKTPNSAHVEFTAQQHTPDRDFETVIQFEGGQPAVTLIPHRRGDDGYFMLLLTPPAPEDAGPRETLPDGDPLELLVLADTSGSMDETGRENQADFLAALFSALTSDDRINVAACDVECNWVFEAAQPATRESIIQARDFVGGRVSLGWTDLDKAFRSAVDQCGPNTHVIYIGDGVVTAGDADPVAFSKRLRRMFADRALADREAAFHAVSVGSSFESIVLNTIASLGGGSVRQISGQQTPQRVAAELLRELTRPPVRDLKIEFQGLRVARVYPRQLPNLAAGQQQIVIGRYLPEGEDQQGSVIVTGQNGEKRVEIRVPVSLKDAGQSNSFIPRLWARKHLDALLEQGASAAVRDEIIALSEEYNIITPYTSLLVLESDADRERFKVKRRFRMRDGEKFFAEGRDRADFELIQKQMRLAGNWRVGMRRRVLRELSGLGRDADALQQAIHLDLNAHGAYTGVRNNLLAEIGSYYGTGLSGRGAGPASVSSVLPVDYAEFQLGLQANIPTDVYRSFLRARVEEYDDPHELGFTMITDGLDRDAQFQPVEGLGEEDLLEEFEVEEFEEVVVDLDSYVDTATQIEYPDIGRMSGEAITASEAVGWGRLLPVPRSSSARGLDGAPHYRELTAILARQPGQGGSWLTNLFSNLPPAPPETSKPPKRRWPPAAQRLSDALLRTQQIAALDGGIAIRHRFDSFDERWNELIRRSESLTLVSPTGWLTRNGGGASETVTHWCDNRQRGVFSNDIQLGRVRDAEATDLTAPPLELAGYVQMSLEATWGEHSVELQQTSDDRVLIVLTHSTSPANTRQILVDTQRNVILWTESRRRDRVIETTRFDDFVRVAGAWWATRVEHLNQDGQREALSTIEFSQLNPDDFGRRLQKELAPRQHVQFLREPLTTITDAKQALADGKAGFDDRMALAAHFAGQQNWDRAFEHFEQAEEAAAGAPGMRWIRNGLLNQGRRREELKKRVLDEAERLARSPKASYFLVERLRSWSSVIFENNEMLALLDVLKPAYDRQPAYLGAAKTWMRQRVGFLDETGQADEVLRLRRQLAERYPRDHGLQRQYAQALSQTGDFAAAYGWLDGAIVPAARWSPQEEDILRGTYAYLLRRQGRVGDLVEYLADWVACDPPGKTAYAQYLTALVKTDQEQAANRLVVRWLQIGEKPGNLAVAEAARLEAAVSYALGQGYDLYTNRLEERWLEPLADVVRRMATHPSHAIVSNRIMSQWRFTETDACRSVRRDTLRRLLNEIATLPAGRISSLVRWALSDDPAVEASQWRKIADGLTARWAAESDVNVKDKLAAPLIRVLGKLDAQQQLAFLRRQVAEGPEEHRADYARQLFDELLGRPWSSDHEAEAFSLLPRLTDSEDPAERLCTLATDLMRLTDVMLPVREGVLMAQVEHPENLSRTELRKKQKENERAAREGFAQRLRAQRPRQPNALAPWIDVERLYLDVLLSRNLDSVTKECWKALGPDPHASFNTDDEVASLLDTVLRRRHLAMLAHLAVRPDAKPGAIDRLIRYVDRGIGSADDGDEIVTWRQFKFDLLIGLDRPTDVEKALRSWIRPEDADNRWRRALGYLMAELGRLDEAIVVFEQIEKADELGPTDYRTLAGWYLAVDAREKHERALIEALTATPERQLRNRLSNVVHTLLRDDRDLPSELDVDVLRIVAVLLKKSSHPRNCLGQLNSLYQATRDFRLLSAVADATVGQTAGQVYLLLGSLRPLLYEVRDEATADSIVEYLARVRGRAINDVDHRALDLLELLVERNSSELLDQPGPHVARALAAMQRAFKREWSDGEPRLMADFLAKLGRMSQPSLAAEQVRQLEVLHKQVARGTVDRLHIAHALARTHWDYDRQDEAVDLLTTALDEWRVDCKGVLPTSANGAIDTLIAFYEDRMHHARCERFLFNELEHPANPVQYRWLEQRLYSLYDSAIDHGGTVSLGSGEALYRAVNLQLHEKLDTDNSNHRAALLDRLCTIYRTAHEKKIPGVVADLRQFAFGRLPDVLGRRMAHYQDNVGRVAETLYDVAGPRDGLELLAERIESEPRWFRLDDDDGWRENGYLMARWRGEVGADLGDLESRLLAIVLKELIKDLASGRERRRHIYHKQCSHFWEEKTADFARAAEEIYAQRKGSGAAVKHIADYLYRGLERHKRAIEILLVAHREKSLDKSGQHQVVEYLLEQNRHAESIPLLEPLVASRPWRLEYRGQLMHAYYRVGRQDKLLALLKQTDEYFHQEGRWQEDTMAALAHICLENHLFERSAAYFEEVIALHQRTQPGRGIGSGTLSEYYAAMSQAYAGMKKTPEAVDAACGAIVSWGRRHDRRALALKSLEDVLRNSSDLAAYVAQLDKQTAGSGQENPIVRKALGKIYFERNEYEKAIVQLKAAVELQPNDTETHRTLVACHDKLNDADGAVNQLLASLRLSRRNLELYTDLGGRYENREQPEAAERAYTSLVEALPNESEGHAALAEIRQKQHRWPDAIAHWKQVARIRSLEPTGLLKLAAAQIHQRQWPAATETCRQLRARTWPARFDEVEAEVQKLESQIEAGSRQE